MQFSFQAAQVFSLINHHDDDDDESVHFWEGANGLPPYGPTAGNQNLERVNVPLSLNEI